MWGRVGTRPERSSRRSTIIFMFSAPVSPETGDACGLISPHVNTEVMNAFLQQFSRELPADVHAALILDRARLARRRRLQVPENITLIHLPPKSPGAEPGGETVALSAQPLLVKSAVQNLGRSQIRRHGRLAKSLPCARTGQDLPAPIRLPLINPKPTIPIAAVQRNASLSDSGCFVQNQQ